MSDYEPDPQTAKLFARYKQAAKVIKDERRDVLKAAEEAIRQGAKSPELAALTGMSGQTFRTLAEKIGADARSKPPTTGPEAEARKAQASVRPESTEQPQSGFIPHLPVELGLEPAIRKLTPAQVKAMVEQVQQDHPEWARKSRRLFASTLPTYLPYALANDALINEKVELPAE